MPQRRATRSAQASPCATTGRGVPYHAVALASQLGQKGTKELLEQYGDRLACARYRYDAQHKTRFETVELIVAQRDWDPPSPRFADDALVAVRVGFAEVELRQRVKQAGGTWNPSRKA